ncbi:MAG: DUF5718 family protein [Arcobacteraceae bacterium]|jgi:hypothetical protein|nr:DUF5718 family protein [Arcobacteraceae bacterium]
MSKKHLKEFIGFGVAGNFAHHLVQAGEASDFVNVVTQEENAPKGMFPFYLPSSDTFLGTYPLSNESIVYPKDIKEGNLQMEPEVALICEVVYENEKVIDLIPNFFTAYNDCSIRKPNAKKISEKKNWGENTKGISSQILPIDKFEIGGVMDNYHIASFLKRDGIIYPYGEDSAVLTYNYFYGKLKKWMIEKLNIQEDFGPLEDLATHIKNSHFPKGLIVSIGATSYTEFGEKTFLEVGDEIFVILYDATKISFKTIVEQLNQNKFFDIKDASILHQSIV